MTSKNAALLIAIAVLALLSSAQALANTYGSIEPVANDAVVNTQPLRDQTLEVRKAFAERFFQCGVVDAVLDALNSTGAINTIDDQNTRFAISAGGFAGETNPAYVFTAIDDGPNAASIADIQVLTNSLAYVLSQGSAFLLDADNPDKLDFPANYVVLNFATPPSMGQSAALFETVGRIDPELFATDTSGYTQYGRAYVSLQSDVDDAQFIAGYRQAAQEDGVEYTPMTGDVPSLFRGGAAFPGNDWSANAAGEEYLARIPSPSHELLGRIREAHLRFTREALGKLTNRTGHGGTRTMQQLKCRVREE
jgi:hypothetical protein